MFGNQLLQAQANAMGILEIVPLGQIQVEVTHFVDDTGTPSATVSFGGAVQAHITFDATGTRPVGIFLYNPTPTLQLQESVQNIVNWCTGANTLH